MVPSQVNADSGNTIDNISTNTSTCENIGLDQLTDRQSIICGTNDTPTSAICTQIPSGRIDNKKRSHTKQRIESYFYQLTIGCGNSDCRNENCASNIHTETFTPNQAAARAIKLFSEDAKFCNFLPSKYTGLGIDGKTFFDDRFVCFYTIFF